MKSKKLLSLLLSLTIIFAAVGCNPDTQAKPKTSIQQVEKEVKIPKQNNNLKQEQVFEKLKKSIENINSVTANYKIKVTKLDKDNKPVQDTNNIEIFSKILYSKEKDENKFNKISAMYDKSNIDGIKKQAYVDMKNNKIYLNDDGKGFKLYTGKDLKPQTESSYIPMVRAVILTSTLSKEKQLKFEEKEKTYELTFKGKNNGDLFYMIDGLFGIGMELMKLDEVNIDVKYEIRKTDFAIVKVTHTAVQKVEGDNYKTIGEFELLGLNDINKIEEAKNIK